jgi:hypothetical protein
VRSRWLSVALVAATVPVHGYALARVMTRYQSGIDAPLNPFAGHWLPPGGPLLPLMTLTLGLAALVALSIVTESKVPIAVVNLSGGLDNGSVKPTGRRAERATKSSTTDAATH